jgi:hypothetical protein
VKAHARSDRSNEHSRRTRAGHITRNRDIDRSASHILVDTDAVIVAAFRPMLPPPKTIPTLPQVTVHVETTLTPPDPELDPQIPVLPPIRLYPAHLRSTPRRATGNIDCGTMVTDPSIPRASPFDAAPSRRGQSAPVIDDWLLLM